MSALSNFGAQRRMYLIRTAGRPETWYAVHPTAKPTGTSRTLLAVFTHEEHAKAWAATLEVHHDEHGHYPSREYTRQPTKLSCVTDGAALELRQLEVVRLQPQEVLGMMMGTGMGCQVINDPSNLRKKMDVLLSFDKAATCARLEAALSAAEVPGFDGA